MSAPAAKRARVAVAQTDPDPKVMQFLHMLQSPFQYRMEDIMQELNGMPFEDVLSILSNDDVQMEFRSKYTNKCGPLTQIILGGKKFEKKYPDDDATLLIGKEDFAGVGGGGEDYAEGIVFVQDTLLKISELWSKSVAEQLYDPKFLDAYPKYNALRDAEQNVMDRNLLIKYTTDAVLIKFDELFDSVFRYGGVFAGEDGRERREMFKKLKIELRRLATVLTFESQMFRATDKSIQNPEHTMMPLNHFLYVCKAFCANDGTFPKMLEKEEDTYPIKEILFLIDPRLVPPPPPEGGGGVAASFADICLGPR